MTRMNCMSVEFLDTNSANPECRSDDIEPANGAAGLMRTDLTALQPESKCENPASGRQAQREAW